MVQAAISFEDGFAFWYLRGSDLSDSMALFEFIFVALFTLLSMAITISAVYGAVQIWNEIELRDAGVAADGFYGESVSWLNVLKLYAIGGTVSLTTLYTGYSIGESISDMIGWFDEWSDDEGFRRREERNTNLIADNGIFR